MYILHSGNSLIWIQVMVNAYIEYMLTLQACVSSQNMSVFQGQIQKHLSLCPFAFTETHFPRLAPPLGVSCQHPLHTVVAPSAEQLLYE